MTIPTLTLNDDQQAGADTFFQFLLGPEPEMIISGPGGVGKTTLMSHLIDVIMPRYNEMCRMLGEEPQFDEVEMTATTNKAAQVLSEATGRPARTIHSFLGLKVKDDFKTGKSILTKREGVGGWRVHERLILFIDEASMIDSPLLALIREGTHKSKIIYVGDHNQLAPVMEPISPVYRNEKPFVQLLKPMRNNNQLALMELCNQLRETVETGIFKPIKIVPGVIDLLDDTQMQVEIANRFTHQTHDTRILAYTNGRVMQYNEHIRGLRQLPHEYTIGEFLVNNSAIQLRDRMLSVEEEFTVVGRSNTVEEIPVQGDVTLKVRRYSLENRLGEIIDDVKVPIDRAHFDELCRYFKRTTNWPQFYLLKNVYPDLRQRDAATFHKAQGSTYDTVFIDLTNLSTCHNPNVVARMLYVAVTRPRTRIFFYGELAAKYGGLIH